MQGHQSAKQYCVELKTHNAYMCDFTDITTRNNKFVPFILPDISMLLCDICTKFGFKSKDICTLCISVVKFEFELIIYLNKWGLL